MRTDLGVSWRHLYTYHTEEEIQQYKAADKRKPKYLRPNFSRQQGALNRLKAKWTKGDDDDTSNSTESV